MISIRLERGRWSSARALRRVAGLVVLGSLVCPSARAAGSAGSSLPSGERSVCIAPKTRSQSVRIPATGGITATLTFAAFPAGVTGCVPMRLGTGKRVAVPVGSEATVPPAPAIGRGMSAMVTQTPEPSKPPAPLLTITIGAGTDAAPFIPLTRPILVTGTTLTAAASLKLPDGIYIATVTQTDGTRGLLSPNLRFIARKGVLRVAPIVGLNGQPLPLMEFVDGTSTLALYPLGVMPPEPIDDVLDTPSTTPGDPATSIPLPATTIPPTPPLTKPTSGAFGRPLADGPLIGSVTFQWSGCTTDPRCVQTRPIQFAWPASPLDIPAGFEGVAEFSTNIGYMGIRQVIVTGCPPQFSVVATVAGSGTLSVPPGIRGTGCRITFSTLPKGKQGTYYTFELAVRELDQGTRPR